MELKQEEPCRKKNGKERSFEFKTFVMPFQTTED